MNGNYCEKEQQLGEALRSDSCTLELQEHARQCPVCHDVLLVANFLREEANLRGQELSTLPEARSIWRETQALAREKALVWATLPIRIVKTSAFVVAVVAMTWCVFEYRIWRVGTNLGHRDLSPVTRLWPSALSDSTLLLVSTGTLICIGLSSWYMIREQ